MKAIQKIIESLKAAAIELEELQVQAVLGKAEARDKYELARKKFTKSLGKARKIAEEKYKGLKFTLEALEVQFVLGKALKQNFKKKGQKFTNILNELEAFLKKQNNNH